MTDRALSITSIMTSVAMFIGMVFIHFNPLNIKVLKPKANVGEINITDVKGLQNALNGKANSVHIHEMDNIKGLQDALNNREDA